MKRRDFLRGAVAASAGFASGCIPVSFEQGLFSECRTGIVGAEAKALVQAAWQGLRVDRVWDVHAHILGNGRSGSGIWIDPDLDRPQSIIGRARHAFFRNAACIGDDDERMDQGMVERLVQLAGTLPAGAKIILLAFDFAYDETGRRRDDHTTFAVPDAYARRIAAAHPARFEWIASIHPYRADAAEALAAAKLGGARAVKWLPPAMGIDLRTKRAGSFYEGLRKHDMPLLVHVGDEQAVPGARRDDLGNPLFLRHPLDAGVRVIAAHCATLGRSADLDVATSAEKAPTVSNLDLFARLMNDRRYEKLLFGDISAVTQSNRLEHLPAIIARREWHPRLLNGSDYPLPGMMPLFSLKDMVSRGILDERLIPPLRELRESNALAFDFALKRNLKVGGAGFPASVFETRGFFERV